MSIQAFIDLGTNTFHCLIVNIKSRKDYEVIQNKSVFVKIGSKGFSDKIIHPEAMLRAQNAINLFQAMITNFKVDEVFLVATSAIRNAANKTQLIGQLVNFGWNIKVIDGLREAELIYKGILLDSELDFGNETFITMDIGGGSVEFSIANRSNIYWSKSFEIGAQRLKDNFHKYDTITSKEILELRKFLTKELKELFNVALSLKPICLIGSSGTFDTLIDHQNILVGEIDNRLKYTTFESFYQMILDSTFEERIKIPGVHSERAEMLVVALVLLEVVLENINLESIFVSKNALKEGMLYEALEKI